MLAKTVPYWLYWQTSKQMHNIRKNMSGYLDLIFEYLMSFVAVQKEKIYRVSHSEMNDSKWL